jgi:hypothetical protein
LFDTNFSRSFVLDLEISFISITLRTSQFSSIVIEIVNSTDTVSAAIKSLLIRTVVVFSAHSESVEVSGGVSVFTILGVVLDATSCGLDQSGVDTHASTSNHFRVLVTFTAFEAASGSMIAVISPDRMRSHSTLTSHFIRFWYDIWTKGSTVINAVVHGRESDEHLLTSIFHGLSPTIIDVELMAMRIESHVVNTMLMSDEVISTSHTDLSQIISEVEAFTDHTSHHFVLVHHVMTRLISH